MRPADYADWIGRSVIRRDVVTERLVAQFRATLAPHLFDAECPPGLHWCLAVPAHPPENLGPDGAEKKGLFLPPIDLPLRRWWGGELQIFGGFQIGDQVERASRVVSLDSPPSPRHTLFLVAVEHVLSVRGATRVHEVQNLVYLNSGPVGDKMPDRATSEQVAAHDSHWHVAVDQVMLFRYSALTFNGHRIHYDRPFAENEGQSGLLVHGPLQATLLLNQFAALKNSAPKQFSYQCLSPLVAPQSAQVVSRLLGGSGQGTVLTDDGVITVRSTANW